jgi:serine/threonine-protein kinase
VVLFEMLAGRRLFEGETVSETLASVMKEPIGWSALPPSTPPVIRRLLRRCLERDSKNRLHDIGDALLDLDEALEGKEERAATPQRRVVMPWILAVALAVLVGMVVLRWPERPVEQPLMRLELDLGPSAALASIWGPTAVLSPDGTRLVYIANGPDGNSLLMTRLVDRTEATPLPGTEGAAGPFFSPDGQWVAFHAGGKLKKISVNGGAAVVLCEAPVLVGGSWGEDGNIIAALSLRGLSRIPSAGSDPQPFTQPHESHRWPQILPGGDAVLFTAGSAGAIQDTASIVVQALNTGRRKVLLRGGYYGRYLPSGHLVYMQQGTLFAVGFDPDKWELVGRPVPVVDDIASYGASGGANFDFSRTGTFVYTSGRMASLTSSLMWLDGAGRLDPLPVKPATYVAPRLSPDGKRLAFIRVEAGGQGLWVYEWQRDIMQRLPVTAAIATPVWTPDGRHIVFTSGQEIQRIRADGSAKPQRLTDSKDQRYPFSFSPDGKTLAFVELSKETSWDIWTLPLAGDNPDDPKPGEPKLFLRTQFTEWAPAFSPDGRWLAYTSDESGNFGVYVQPFPQGGGRWLVSGGGGRGVIWSRTRAELFYLASGGRIMSAAYSVKGGSFVPAARRQWSERRLPLFPVWLSFDLAPDGNRMIFLTTGEEQEKPETHLTFLLNFFDELRRRVPAGGK